MSPQLQQLRQGVVLGGLDFSLVFAQLRRNEIELELGVNLLFTLAGHRLVVLQIGQAVFAERETHLQGALAQRHVVRLGAGEVLHGRAKRLRRQQPHIHLHPVALPEADLVLALRDHVHQAGKAQQVLSDLLPRFGLRTGFAGDQDVEVPHRIPPPPQRSCRRDLLDPRHLRQMLDQLLRHLLGAIEQEPSADPAVILNRLQQLLFLLFAHAWQSADLALARQLFDPIDVAHLVRAPDQSNRFRAQPLDLQQLQHGRPVLFQQLGMHLQPAFAENLLHVQKHALADAGHFQKLLRFLDQLRHLLGQGFDGLRRIAIRAHAKRVLPVNLEQIRSFVENGGDGFVIHGWRKLYRRCRAARRTRIHAREKS